MSWLNPTTEEQQKWEQKQNAERIQANKYSAAFPIATSNYTYPGMSLRAYYIGQTLPAIIKAHPACTNEEIAKMVIDLVDKLFEIY